MFLEPQAEHRSRSATSGTVGEVIDVHHGFAFAIPAFRINGSDAMLSHVGEWHGIKLSAFGVTGAARVAGHGTVTH
jgi:hypothetical protein